jgi:hypothetical protein
MAEETEIPDAGGIGNKLLLSMLREIRRAQAATQGAFRGCSSRRPDF